MKRKIFVVGGNTHYANWMEGENVKTIVESDLVVFTGGTDVNPEIYGEPRHPKTQPSDIQRDAEEIFEFETAMHLGKKMIGICRGAQFLCVMAGGKLVQHQDNNGSHQLWGYSDRTTTRILVTSDHHQAQFPWGLPMDQYRVLGLTINESSFHYDGLGREMLEVEGGRRIEVEDAYYPKINGLAIQCHPEWMVGADNFRPALAHYRKLLDMHMDSKL